MIEDIDIDNDNPNLKEEVSMVLDELRQEANRRVVRELKSKPDHPYSKMTHIVIGLIFFILALSTLAYVRWESALLSAISGVIALLLHYFYQEAIRKE